MMTRNAILRETTAEYLRHVSLTTPLEDVEEELVSFIKNKIYNHNHIYHTAYKAPDRLDNAVMADVIVHMFNVVNIDCNPDGDSETMLAIYDNDKSSRDYGLYVPADDLIADAVRKLNYLAKQSDIKEVIISIKLKAPIAHLTMDKHLVPVANGVFNYSTKKLYPFDPDKYVFLGKMSVPFDATAVNPEFEFDTEDGKFIFNFDKWLMEIADDRKELYDLLWEVISSVCRPFAHFDKLIFFVSNTGANGKGSLLRAIRSLCGERRTSSISLRELSEDKYIGPAIFNQLVILSDENRVSKNKKLEGLERAKLLATGDIIRIEYKYRDSFDFRFSGRCIFCLNDNLKLEDTTGSAYRRILSIPFLRSFVGKENKYLKSTVLVDERVLRYILNHALMCVDCDEDYHIPDICLRELDDIKTLNDPIRELWKEIEPVLVWDIVPFSWLYEVYKGFLRKNYPSEKPLNRSVFIDDLLDILDEEEDALFYCEDKGKRYRTGDMMSKSEILTYMYDVRDFMDLTQDNIYLMCIPVGKTQVRGILRKTVKGDTCDE